jgi:protein tyrosine phosphatase (PTP) superfamily phosphohydrolase (DUF442 family)
MKKVTTLMIIAMFPLLAMAQGKSVTRFQDRYMDNNEVTFVTIKGPLFKFIGSLAEYDDDPDSQAIAGIANGINSMEILQVPYYETDLSRDEVTSFRNGLAKESYEELMLIKEGRKVVNIMAQGGEDEIRNMLILVDEKEEFTLLSINGKLSMKDLSYLSKHHNNFH